MSYFQLFPQVLKAISHSQLQAIGLICIYIITAVVPTTETPMLIGITFLKLFAVYLSLILISQVIRTSLHEQGWQGSTFESLTPIFFIGIVYNLVGIVLLCLLVIPGLWWLSRSCLAVVISVATGELNCFTCLSQSASLTKNQLMEVIKYMWPPIAMLLFIIVITVVGELSAKKLGNAGITTMTSIFESIGTFILVQLGALPMLVNLYLRLNYNRQA